ncbi:helix-turn-helix domain-containing protein [Granulicella mallensis]|uniref:DNA-binding HxlR family transcriptional regulator n=1 Tax=Granulicella mallensis TaxID=940614 RepID=A0A7W7ZKR7_9BACT|nr:helix-turn-helix domain-containing protein [Granulicella mallensis]MBB5061749.1 DNA-binding HxlR family transcriptional regulator [Granulicella mallensis]
MKKTTKTKWEEATALCDGLSEDQDTLTREIVTGLADKWTLWVMSVLAEAGEPLRFSRVMEQVEGISQKSLTKTLRQLERDGLVTRKMFAEVPPRVEYAITPIAIEMLDHVEPLWTWVAKSVGRFQEARTQFDQR